MSLNISKLASIVIFKQSGNLLSIFVGTIYPYELQQKGILTNYIEHVEMLALSHGYFYQILMVLNLK